MENALLCTQRVEELHIVRMQHEVIDLGVHERNDVLKRGRYVIASHE